MTGTLYRPAAVAIAALVCTVGVRSQDGGVDARALSALEQMRAAYLSADALHIRVTWTARYEGIPSYEAPLGPDVFELRMQRPNKFYMEASSTRGERPSRYVIVSDGTDLWYWRSVPNTYIQVAAPATLRDLPALLPEDAIGTFDGLTWTNDDISEWDLLVDDDDVDQSGPPDDDGIAITLGTPTKIGSTAVDVVKMTSRPASSQMPFEFEQTYYLSASTHLIQGSLLIDRGIYDVTGKPFRITKRAVYDVLETHPRFTAVDFTFTPPPGAKIASTRMR